MFKILLYLFSAAFVAVGIYTCVKVKKEREEKSMLIVGAIFNFSLAVLSFYFAHWGFITV